ncbi:MAG: N-6 DNA methylase [Bdellovibrionales bacterium]|nr:N-6 DNA methylase [Bdellovibrionales bacterium]
MDTEKSRFFIVVPPGLERAALYELHRFYSDVFQTTLSEFEQFPGGIEVALPLVQGLQLNFLKIPVRVLLRLASREISSEDDFIAFIKEQEWGLFGTYRKIYVSSRTSELRFKENLENIFKRKANLKQDKAGSDIYIRFFRDECTFSIDTSGEDLYVRGGDKWVGEAPLRDNIAAGILQFSVQGISNFQDWVLVDPVVGSGTFLLEANNMHLASPRTYGFQTWKIPLVKEVVVPEIVQSSMMDFHHLYGFDLDEKVVRMAEKNMRSAHLQKATIAQRDAFDKKGILKEDHKKLVIMNPPYGKRIKIKERNYFPELLESVISWTQADRLGIIVPRGVMLSHPDYEMVRSLDMLNSGIEIFFYLFLKREKVADKVPGS